MKKSFESFSGRLTRSVVITVLVIMTIISVFVFFVATYAMLVFNKAHYSDIMGKTNDTMALLMSKVEVSAENIIDELAWHLDTPGLVSSTMEYELNVNRHIYGCGIGFVPDYYPEQGRWYEPYALSDEEVIRARNIGSETHDYLNLEWYLKGLNSPEGVWCNPYLDEVGGGTVLCTYSRPVIDPEGRTAGVFGADMSLEALSSLVGETVKKENEESPFIGLIPKKEGFKVYCFIIGPGGEYIVHPETERILKANFYDFAPAKDTDRYMKLGEAMNAGEKGEMTVFVDGVKSDVYFAPLLSSGWSMGIVVPMHRLMRPGYLFAYAIIFLILLGLLIMSAVCRHSIEKTSRPLIKLAESAKEVATGHFDTELPLIKTNDEIRLLRDSFDNMQKSLSNYIDELTETTAQKASMESELGVARSIQMSMLPMTWPAFPDRNDLDIYGSVTPAKAVGGDLYDFCIRDGKLFFCIGDVSGKGIPASLVMTVVDSMFRTLSASEDSPAAIVSAINSSLSSRNDSMMFVTLFVGVLDLSNGLLLYSNAGHNAPVVIAAGEPRMLDVDSNLAVGIMEGWEYSQQEMVLAPGSVLFLYTDGLSEAARVDGSLFGDERILEHLSGQGEGAPVRSTIDHMTSEVGKFVGDAEQSDDLTMMAIRLT